MASLDDYKAVSSKADSCMSGCGAATSTLLSGGRDWWFESSIPAIYQSSIIIPVPVLPIISPLLRFVLSKTIKPSGYVRFNRGTYAVDVNIK